jgi:hypothetical protein
MALLVNSFARQFVAELRYSQAAFIGIYNRKIDIASMNGKRETWPIVKRD